MARVIGVQYSGSSNVYSYLASDDLHEKVQVGDYVVVPVARSGQFPYSVARVLKKDYEKGHEQTLPFKLKAVISVIGQ